LSQIETTPPVIQPTTDPQISETPQFTSAPLSSIATDPAEDPLVNARVNQIRERDILVQQLTVQFANGIGVSPEIV
jgi:hypothetical protein